MYEIIKDRLATHGIGDDYIVQPPELTRTREIIFINGEGPWYILDARVLSDEGLSRNSLYEYLIETGCHMLMYYKPVVVCCGAGQSRSNAIALGILVQHFKMDFYDAYELIREKVPIQWILPDHIAKLKQIFNVTIP